MNATEVAYGQALKDARRNIYTHPEGWTVMVVSDSHQKTVRAFDEAVLTLGASSLKVERANYAQLVIETERGGKFIFRTLYGPLRGYEYQHLVTISRIDPIAEQDLLACLRGTDTLYQHADL